MWKEFKRMVLEAAAETVGDPEVKKIVVEVWGKLVSQVIGEIKNGALVKQTSLQALDRTKRKKSGNLECHGDTAAGFWV